MAGTTIRDLPEELLTDILSHFASEQHDVDFDTLKACALVHSTWRDPAHRIICGAGVELETEADVAQWTRTRRLRRYAPRELGVRAYKSRTALGKLLDGCDGLRWLMLATPTRNFDPAVLAHPALSGALGCPFLVSSSIVLTLVTYCRPANPYPARRDPPPVSRPRLPVPPPFSRRRRHRLSFPSPRLVPQHHHQDFLGHTQDPIIIRLLLECASSSRHLAPLLRLFPYPFRPLARLCRLIRPVPLAPLILLHPRILRMHLPPRSSPVTPPLDSPRPRDNRRRAANPYLCARCGAGTAQGHQEAVFRVLEGGVLCASGRAEVGERDGGERRQVVVCG